MSTNKTVTITIPIPDGLTKDGETRFILAKCISFALNRHKLSVKAKKDMIDWLSKMIMAHRMEEIENG